MISFVWTGTAIVNYWLFLIESLDLISKFRRFVTPCDLSEWILLYQRPFVEYAVRPKHEKRVLFSPKYGCLNWLHAHRVDN
jgi:hypothetical protein